MIDSSLLFILWDIIANDGVFFKPALEIFGVTETSSDEGVAFLVTMKDEKNWYVVKSDVYGNLEQTEKFRRADNW